MAVASIEFGPLSTGAKQFQAACFGGRTSLPIADWKRIMPTTIFDWIARTAMLVMAGLVTLSILGAIAAMTNDPGTGFAPGDRPLIEAQGAKEREVAPAPPAAQEGTPTTVAAGGANGATVIAAPP